MHAYSSYHEHIVQCVAAVSVEVVLLSTSSFSCTCSNYFLIMIVRDVWVSGVAAARCHGGTPCDFILLKV